MIIYIKLNDVGVFNHCTLMALFLNYKKVTFLLNFYKKLSKKKSQKDLKFSRLYRLISDNKIRYIKIDFHNR